MDYIYAAANSSLAHLCINPNHNNQSKGHFKFDITTVLFSKLRSITDSEYMKPPLNLPNQLNYKIRQVSLKIRYSILSINWGFYESD